MATRTRTVARRPVDVGEARGEFRQVLEGLRSGERVVLDPPAGLEDGSRVRVE
jgi:multidrug efflux pump subunit AcrA (membrane-fusion protein)